MSTKEFVFWPKRYRLPPHFRPVLYAALTILAVSGCIESPDRTISGDAQVSGDDITGSDSSGYRVAMVDAASSSPDLRWDPKKCGNGQMDRNESCDTAIQDSCPTSCTQIATCAPAQLIGADTCGARCVLAPLTACESGDGCCPPDCTADSDADCPQACTPTSGAADCGGKWLDGNTGRIVRAGLGLREPPVTHHYGDVMTDGKIVLPQCAHLTGTVRIPIIMVDWSDYNPATDPSDENSPTSNTPGYVRSSPSELSAYLNGTLHDYFADISGQQLNLEFDVLGWVTSEDGSYLKTRETYISTGPDESACDNDDIILDALREAIVSHDLDLNQYDADCNNIVDAFAVVYEGTHGLCLATQASVLSIWKNDKTNPPVIKTARGDTLVESSDPNYARFASQRVGLSMFAEVPERYGAGENFLSIATWAHELGHVLWGNQDYYKPGFEVDHYGLSSFHRYDGWHPAALEKWLFGKWIDAQQIDTSGSYTLAANEIADGTTYDSAATYIYVVHPDGDPNRFITIESRWFDDAGNTSSSWASTADVRESGLVIFEVNLTWPYSSNLKHIYRHEPEREEGAPNRAFRPGDTFEKCFKDNCLKIEPVDAPGANTGFELTLSPKAE